MNSIVELDRSLFQFLNSKHSEFLDPIMYWMSEKAVWFPFYAILLFVSIKYIKKKSFVIIPVIAALIASADQLSQFFKYSFLRPRPCREEALLMPVARQIEGYGCSAYGYFSAHASNTFAIAMFFTLLLSAKYPKIKLILFPWAILVSYSRIYLGVHYPADVLTGALFGVVLAIVWHWIYKKLTIKFNL